jgi:hypothetical protein
MSVILKINKLNNNNNVSNFINCVQEYVSVHSYVYVYLEQC